MHRHDEMTPKERMAALMSGKPIDRLPILPMVGGVAANLVGVTNREYRNSIDLRIEGQVKAYERFGHDGTSVDYGSFPVAIALGGKLNDPEDNLPALIENPIQDLNDLSKLDLELVEKDMTTKELYEFACRLQERVGAEVGTSAVIGGPFTVAAGIVGTERLLKGIIKNPEAVHKLLDFAVQAILVVATPLLKIGVNPVIVDPVASGSILRTDQYDKFALPYTKSLITEYKKLIPGGIILHICGNTTNILRSMAESGADSISLDNIVDLEMAKKTIGHLKMISGNVDPVNVMYLGNKESIDQAVKTCFKKAFDSPQGFVISTGCDLPLKTPLENIDYFMESCRKYAKMPLNPANFS